MTRLPSCFCFLRLLVLAIAAAVLAAHSSLAGPLATTPEAFFGTVNGIPGHDGGFWRGHDGVNNVVINGFDGLSVDVDFAVFAPGAGFDNFLFGEFGVNDPTDGTKFVYAFQAAVISGDNGIFGSFPPAGLTQLFTGYDPGEDANIVQQGFVTGTGVAPLPFPATRLNNSSAQFGWSGISASGTSSIVYYTSPFAPQPDGVSVGSGNGDAGSSGFTSFASPIPEPSSLILLAGGVVLTMFRRLRR